MSVILSPMSRWFVGTYKYNRRNDIMGGADLTDSAYDSDTETESDMTSTQQMSSSRSCSFDGASWPRLSTSHSQSSKIASSESPQMLSPHGSPPTPKHEQSLCDKRWCPTGKASTTLTSGHDAFPRHVDFHDLGQSPPEAHLHTAANAEDFCKDNVNCSTSYEKQVVFGVADASGSEVWKSGVSLPCSEESAVNDMPDLPTCTTEHMAKETAERFVATCQRDEPSQSGIDVTDFIQQLVPGTWLEFAYCKCNQVKPPRVAIFRDLVYLKEGLGFLADDGTLEGQAKKFYAHRTRFLHKCSPQQERLAKQGELEDFRS